MKQLLTICFLALFFASKAVGQIPVPTGLSAEVIATDSMNYVTLTWNKKNADDSLTVGYNILSNFPPHSDLMISQKVGVVYDTTYLFPITNSRGATYRFAIMGLSNFPKVQRSDVSKVVDVLVPSTQIPHVNLKKVERENQKLVLHWDYPDTIGDLEGFKILMNNEVVSKTKANKRSLEFPINEDGSYIFQVQAYTSNVVSKPSQKRLIKIEN